MRKTAIELARKYGADEKKAEIAALFHDMYRGVPEKSLNYYVKNLGLDESAVGITCTTLEGIGIVGREEGIAVQAYCLTKKGD